MSCLPTWAVWSIFVLLILLSPVIAFLLAMVAEMLIWTVVDEGVPAAVALGAAFGGLFLFRRLSTRSGRRSSSGKA
jgi:uncharacterized membrane protein